MPNMVDIPEYQKIGLEYHFVWFPKEMFLFWNIDYDDICKLGDTWFDPIYFVMYMYLRTCSWGEYFNVI